MAANARPEQLGGPVSIPVDVRAIAATNIDVRRVIEQERLHECICYRLKVPYLRMPRSLRKRPRPEGLANYFINQ